jgi:autophagy-related protein 27
MRLPSNKPAVAVLLSSMLFPTLIVAVDNFDCSKIATDGKMWDLSKIGGPLSVMDHRETPPTWQNTTYTIDICKDLKRSGNVQKGYECPGGTRGEF